MLVFYDATDHPGTNFPFSNQFCFKINFEEQPEILGFGGSSNLEVHLCYGKDLVKENPVT